MAEIQALMPIINAVANKNMKDKHWKKVFDKIEQPFTPNKEIQLAELLQFKIMDKIDAI